MDLFLVTTIVVGQQLKAQGSGCPETLNDTGVYWFEKGPPLLTHYLAGEAVSFWLSF